MIGAITPRLCEGFVRLPNRETPRLNTASTMYYFGKGVAKDAPEAEKWFRSAAEQGIAMAQHALGIMYDKGKGVAKDAPEAVKWYRRAAEQGIVGSQFELAIKYALGMGVPRNYLQAYVWTSLAASGIAGEGSLAGSGLVGEGSLAGSGLEERLAREGLAQMRDWLAKQLSKSELERAQRIAEEWRPKNE